MVVEGRAFFAFCSCSWQVKDLGSCLWTGCPRKLVVCILWAEVTYRVIIEVEGSPSPSRGEVPRKS